MKTYNNIFLICVLSVVGISAAIMLWSQPITGDLTRISAYPERWFGWNDAQQNIPPTINSKKTTEKRHILVVGDSFSEAGHWQAYLGEQYTFSFIHNGKTSLQRVIERIEKDKPDAIILETAERAFPDMYGNGSVFVTADSNCNLDSTTVENKHTHQSITDKISTLPVFPAMNRATFPQQANDISEGFHIFKLSFKALVKPGKRKAKTITLTQDTLFSNTRNDQILLLAKDFLLYDKADEQSVRAIRCGMLKTSNKIAKLNIPHVVLAIPDKTTAYQHYLKNDEIRQRPSLIGRLHTNQIQHGIDMLPHIQEMSKAGNKDIYLPNDTHWGYKGFQLAAVLIDMELASQWPVKNGAAHD
jgi:hypothetical protein